MIRKIGILTSGGDSPGMNAAVVSVARCAAAHDIQLMGIKRGYNGLLGLSENPEDDIAALEQKIADLDTQMAACGSDYVKLQDLTNEQDAAKTALDEKMERWMYLTDLAEKIAAQEK